MRFLLLAGALALAACSVPSSGIPPSGAAYDRGGNITARTLHIAALEASGEPFTVPTRCMSACTMYLSLSTACFPRDGVLGFHSASAPGRFGPAEFTANRILARHYPDRIAAWFLAGPAHSSDLVMVPMADLIDRGEVRGC